MSGGAETEIVAGVDCLACGEACHPWLRLMLRDSLMVNAQDGSGGGMMVT